MVLRELVTTLIIGAVLLFAIHSMANKKSNDNDSARDVSISITTEKIVIGDDLFSSEIDGVENN